MLTRPDVPEIARLEALAGLADMRKSSLLTELLGALENTTDGGGRASQDLSRVLTRQAPGDLKAVRARLDKLGAGKAPDVVRLSAKAALLLADGSLDAAWAEASKSPAALAEFLKALPFVTDPTLRGTAYEKVKPLATALPSAFEAQLKGATNATGRYVRIELPRQGTLTLAEVQVFSDGKNVAPDGTARQSSTSNGGEAKRGIDGNTNGTFGAGGQTHTREDENNPWWEVDLKQEKPIDAVTVWNRTDDSLGQRLDGFTLTVFDGSRREVFKKTGIPAPRESVRIETGGGDPVGALRRAAIAALVSTGQQQQVVFTTLADLIKKGDQRLAAAQSMVKLPRTAWTKEPADGAATALVEWAKTVPAADRTGQDYIEAVQVAHELAGLLPPEKASTIRKTLRDLSVSVYVVKTVREQLRYDTPRLVVEAGRPFEIIFENDDVMPHNFVVVTPGSHVEIGLASQTMPPTLDGKGRAYIPNTNKILAASKLLEPGQKETLKLTAPSQEGDYEYVCTFPGHAMVMFGRLAVTKDVDAYLRINPTAPAAPTVPTDGK